MSGRVCRAIPQLVASCSAKPSPTVSCPNGPELASSALSWRVPTGFVWPCCTRHIFPCLPSHTTSRPVAPRPTMSHPAKSQRIMFLLTPPRLPCSVILNLVECSPSVHYQILPSRACQTASDPVPRANFPRVARAGGCCLTGCL
jgi:hypothetical protein